VDVDHIEYCTLFCSLSPFGVWSTSGLLGLLSLSFSWNQEKMNKILIYYSTGALGVVMFIVSAVMYWIAMPAIIRNRVAEVNHLQVPLTFRHLEFNLGIHSRISTSATTPRRTIVSSSCPFRYNGQSTSSTSPIQKCSITRTDPM